MVRRWSYLNQVNDFFLTSNFKILNFVHHEETFRATTYYRKKISYISRLSRRSWSRRKHLHSWLIYQNIFTDWAKDYSFFRQYNRFIINYHVFKNSYLVHNLLVYQATSITEFPGSEKFLTSHLVHRTVQYFSRLNPTFYARFKTFPNVSWMFVTSHDNWETITQASTLTSQPMFLAYQNSFYTTELDIKQVFLLQSIIDSFFNIVFCKILELYKILMLTTLFQVL